jgi:hypothetical protein
MNLLRLTWISEIGPNMKRSVIIGSGYQVKQFKFHTGGQKSMFIQSKRGENETGRTIGRY